MFVEMKVRGLALDAVSNMPIIILRDEEDKRSLQIWVGIFEANAIALELEKVAPARPMTHDLIKNILETLEARVLKVVVTDLKENTFFAVLHLQLGETEYTVDSRPSDAIALALRVAAPIYVDEEVIRKAKSLEVTKEAEPVKPDDPGRDAPPGPRGVRPRSVGLRPAPDRRGGRVGQDRPVSVHPGRDVSGVRAGGPVLASDRAARLRARVRHHPRAPSVPARARGAPAGPADATAA